MLDPFTDHECVAAVEDACNWRVGDRVYFQSDKRPFRVQACDTRFAVCTKPFNLKKTVLYTICDFREGVRGTENLIFGMGFETREQCEEALERLQAGETEVSHRNRVPLDIVKVVAGKGAPDLVITDIDLERKTVTLAPAPERIYGSSAIIKNLKLPEGHD